LAVGFWPRPTDVVDTDVVLQATEDTAQSEDVLSAPAELAVTDIVSSEAEDVVAFIDATGVGELDTGRCDAPEFAEVAPAAPAESAEGSELDIIFGLEPDAAAKKLRRYIINGYARDKTAVFEGLGDHIRGRADRKTVAVLVALLRINPPPRTRRWVLAILPELYPSLDR